MPIIKSAQKQVRVTVKKRLRNKSIRSLCKTNTAKAERFIISSESKQAREAVSAAASSLDKAVKRGIIHRNNARRRLSRLTIKLNKSQTNSSNG
ncbi:30S ribosomal protein S20 [Chloroflexota bacterium]